MSLGLGFELESKRWKAVSIRHCLLACWLAGWLAEQETSINARIKVCAKFARLAHFYFYILSGRTADNLHALCTLPHPASALTLSYTPTSGNMVSTERATKSAGYSAASQLSVTSQSRISWGSCEWVRNKLLLLLLARLFPQSFLPN